MMIQLLAAGVTGASALLFVLYAMRSRQLRPADTRIQRLTEAPATARRGISWEEVRRQGPSSLPLLRELLLESAWAKNTQKEIDQAGLKMRVGEYLLGRTLLGIVLFIAIFAIGRSPLALILGLVAAILAFFLPTVWLSVMRKRRINQIAKQLPEAIVLIANSLRAGFAFQHGLGLVTQEMSPPISEEFTRATVDINVGASMEEALTGMLERADSEDMNMLVTAVLIQRSSGGNLAEILETVGETMRERERLYGEIKTMTSQQRFSGMILTLWPMAILAIFSVVNWDHTSSLFTTGIGLVLLTAAGIGQVLGFYTIRRILDIDI